MTEYKCGNCGYSTIYRSYLQKHLTTKQPCFPNRIMYNTKMTKSDLLAQCEAKNLSNIQSKTKKQLMDILNDTVEYRSIIKIVLSDHRVLYLVPETKKLIRVNQYIEKYGLSYNLSYIEKPTDAQRASATRNETESLLMFSLK
jgi:ERCC4-related helicase